MSADPAGTAEVGTIAAIAAFLPEGRLDNQQIAAEHPDWGMDKVGEMTGIRSRCIADPGDTALDLAVKAGQRLLAGGACSAADIDFVILCTQCPDYFLPSGSCLAQHRLGIPAGAGALDINLGCSGYLYSLAVAKGLVAGGIARRILLLNADTYSRYAASDDRSIRPIFGDGATATLITAGGPGGRLGRFQLGSDGGGAQHLMVAGGAARHPGQPPVMRMDGPQIFDFSMRVVPPMVRDLLAGAGLPADGIDLWVFHQANRFMIDHLRRKLRIPPERCPLRLADCGNTGSASIPLVLDQLAADGRLRPGSRLVLLGFGVGLSWGGAIVDWT